MVSTTTYLAHQKMVYIPASSEKNYKGVYPILQIFSLCLFFYQPLLLDRPGRSEISYMRAQVLVL